MTLLGAKVRKGFMATALYEKAYIISRMPAILFL